MTIHHNESGIDFTAKEETVWIDLPPHTPFYYCCNTFSYSFVLNQLLNVASDIHVKADIFPISQFLYFSNRLLNTVSG